MIEPQNPISAETHDKLTKIRQDIHAHPEIGFEEHRTAQIVSQYLTQLGIDHVTGMGGTGVVATLKKGDGNRAIMLRADMDALAMAETTNLPYASRNQGAMHACGHDGHTTMLLGAAEQLINIDFSGTVHLVFQPAEEGLGGAQAMIADGFFDQFPIDAAYGLHNVPGMPLGQIAAVLGPQLACSDRFTVSFEGEGTHGAKPHLGREPFTAAGAFLTQINAIVAREVDPVEPAVISACALSAGDFNALNVIPDVVRIGGTARAYSPFVRDQIEQGIERFASAIACAHHIRATTDYRRGVAPVINHKEATEIAQMAVASSLGHDALVTARDPVMAGDDFSAFGSHVPSCYVSLGMGEMRPQGQHHNTNYDFNDACIPHGVAYWCALVQQELPV